MLYAKDMNGNRVYIADIQQGQSYYCPLCGQELIIKQGTKKIHHFAHKSLKDCDTWAEGMSDWHLEWQQRFTHKNKDLAEVVLEVDGEKHRADIMVNSLVIEFQHSPISQDEFNKRNEFYGKDNNVVWVFDVRDKHITYKLNNKDNKYYVTWKWASMTEYKYNDTIDVYMQVSDDLLIRYEGHREGNKYFNGHGYTVQEFIEHMRNIVRLQKQLQLDKLTIKEKIQIAQEEYVAKHPDSKYWMDMMNYFDWRCAITGKKLGGKKNASNRAYFNINGIKFPYYKTNKLFEMFWATRSTSLDEFKNRYKQREYYNEDRMQKIEQWYNMNIS